MSEITLLWLQSDGTYSQERAIVGDKNVHGRRTQGTVVVDRDTVFQKGEPKEVGSIDDLLSMATPDPPLDNSIRMVVAGHNDAWPVRHVDGMPDQIIREVEIQDQTSALQKMNQITDATQREKQRATIFFMLAISAGVLMMIFVLYGIASNFF